MTLPERGMTASVSLTGLLEGDGQDVPRGNTDVGLPGYVDAILSSGLPGFQHLSGRALRTALDSYLDVVVDRELEEAGLKVRRPQAVQAWLRAYAAGLATTTTRQKIRDAATAGSDQPPQKRAAIAYAEVLTALRVLDELPAWRRAAII